MTEQTYPPIYDETEPEIFRIRRQKQRDKERLIKDNAETFMEYYKLTHPHAPDGVMRAHVTELLVQFKTDLEYLK